MVESFISWRAPNLRPKKSLLLSKDVGSRDWYAGSNIYEDDKRKSGLCGGDYPVCSLVKIWGLNEDWCLMGNGWFRGYFRMACFFRVGDN